MSQRKLYLHFLANNMLVKPKKKKRKKDGISRQEIPFYIKGMSKKRI